jgi:hypothetical protein
MITMEFEEMKKLWDEQNLEPLYVINEAALHKSIQSKKKRASRLSNINDFGLIAIAIGTAILYSFISIINETPAIYDYLIPVILIAIAGYVLIGRNHRKKTERRLGQTMLDDLDHAIASVNYEAKRSKTMVWWFILPLAIPSLLNMIQEEAGWLPMILIVGAFLLSYAVLRWEFNRCHLPKKQRLEALRKKLTEENP